MDLFRDQVQAEKASAWNLLKPNTIQLAKEWRRKEMEKDNLEYFVQSTLDRHIILRSYVYAHYKPFS